MKPAILTALLSVAVGSSFVVACSDSGNSDSGTLSSGTSAGGSGSGASTANGFTDGAGAGSDSSTSLMECASESHEAELAPLMMFIAFDKSGSMDQNSKWVNATSALKAFFQDPGAADLEVALRFFPEGQCDGSTCDIAACATPNVPVGALTIDPAPADAQEGALVNALNSQSPGGGTPMSAALEGAIQFSSQYLTAHPDHKVVVILVTDGEPNGCEENINQIAGLAANGLVEGVPTYTVGLEGSNEAQMQQIATAGGGSSFFIGNGNAQADLLAALQAIRGQQLSCELDIPTPTMGEFNPLLVNVEYTPGGSTVGQTIGNVANEAACGSNGGWYYDDPANPTKILLCPSTCTTAQADADGKISVVLGCDTIPG
jgi:Mg-chelatase subunit ChlD